METTKKRIPILPGLFHEKSSPEDRSYLIGSRCGECGRTYFPKRFVCPVCMKGEPLEETGLSTRGRIDTFSVVHVAPLGFKAPYIQAFVDLSEGPRIFALITGCEPLQGKLWEGEEVDLVITKVAEDEKGNDLIGYQFRPVRRTE